MPTHSIPLDRDLSDRIAILRYLLIVGIVFLHVPPNVPVEDTGPGLFESFRAWIQHGLFRATVPMLTTISAFLLFRGGLDLAFSRLLAKKSRTLLIPLVVGNLPVALALAWLQARGGGMDFSHRLYPPETLTWANAVLGLGDLPVNSGLHFLRDLYVLSLLSPLLGWLARRVPLMGLLALLGVAWFDLDGNLIRRDSMMVNFQLGALVAVWGWDLRTLDHRQWVALWGFLTLSALAVIFQDSLLEVLRLSTPLLIWPASALLLGTPSRDFLVRQSAASFFIFLWNTPLLYGAWLIYRRSLADTLPYWLFWWSSAALTVVLLGLVQHWGSRLFPRFWWLFLGGRQSPGLNYPGTHQSKDSAA